MALFKAYNGLNHSLKAPFKGPSDCDLILEHKSSGLWPLDLCRSNDPMEASLPLGH